MEKGTEKEKKQSGKQNILYVCLYKHAKNYQQIPKVSGICNKNLENHKFI